jgi:hypothetical protein
MKRTGLAIHLMLVLALVLLVLPGTAVAEELTPPTAPWCSQTRVPLRPVVTETGAVNLSVDGLGVYPVLYISDQCPCVMSMVS